MGDEELSFGQRVSARLSAFGNFLYNSEECKFLGRTPKSWALIGVFYLIYYLLLAGFFVGMLSVLLYGIIDKNVPMLTGEHSLMRMNPGLGMRPQPDVARTLVKYNMRVAGSEQENIKSLNELVEEYATPAERGIDATAVKCNLTNANANQDFDPMEKICKMDPSEWWGPCKPPSYGYDGGSPCVVVKMNKVYGWLPKVGNMSEHAMLECKGENDGDAANIGQLEYHPGVTYQGRSYGLFSSALFPYLNQKTYTPPSVAIRFAGVRRNVMVMVECKLVNLENSEYSKVDRQAMVRFELVVYDYNE